MRVLIAGIAITVGAPLVGSVGTVLGMIRAFDALGANGISDTKALAGDVGTCIIGTMCGLIVSASVGLPIFITGIVLLATRPKRPDAATAS